MLKKKTKRRRILKVAAVFVATFGLFMCIPVPHFDTPYATVVTASNGELLGAQIAADGQWRFPASDSYSSKYVKCLLEYEDRCFFFHPGFNPAAFAKAAKANKRAKKIVRGGSTISMQVVRLSRQGKPRSYYEKILEVILAMRLELHYSKTEILNLYAAHAPFGGNVVGIDAAAWRYFNTTPDRLTWAEAATLAVMPNAPSLINIEKKRERLKEKRDNLLRRLPQSKVWLPHDKKINFTADDLELALIEQIPMRPFPLPMLAYHYVVQTQQKHQGERYHSDIDLALQNQVCKLVNSHYQRNKANLIENYGVYVIDYLDQKVVAYVGNNPQAAEANKVDMVRAQRSTGSILKPFLFAAAIDAGILLPTMILPDIPLNLGGYTPKNYSGDYNGAVNADEALTRSLNAPFVFLLRQYGYQRFHALLKQLSLSGIIYSPDHYGLTLIIGGAEASLFDIVNAYGRMGLQLASAVNEDLINNIPDNDIPFSSEAIALTFNVMSKVKRPYEQQGWQKFSSSKQIAWKTGTSFGFRDAWAVGITNRYVVGVWCGNACGEGRSCLTGINIAAPLMFDVFAAINDTYNYPASIQGSNCVEICSMSGFPKSEFCPSTSWINLPYVENMTGVCPYHKKIFLDKTQQFRLSQQCDTINPEVFDYYFVLPPVMEWFYKKHTPTYKPLPPQKSTCLLTDDEIMSFIYPENNVNLVIPTGLNGNKQAVVFEVAHRYPADTIFWDLNEHYLGTTVNNHQMLISVEAGDYVLRCVDNNGNELIRHFKVEEK